jgi:hypothetical protein
MNQEFETSDLSNLLPANGGNDNGSNTPSVSSVGFNEQRKPVFRSIKKTGALTELLIKYSHGKIKNEKQANVVLIISTVVIFILAIVLWPSGGVKVSSQEQLQQQRDMEQSMGITQTPR